MNKIDKIKIGVMAIVATIVTIFTVSVVKAKTLSDITDVEGKGKSVIGNVLYLGYNSIANKMNTYCVQHHKTLRSATKKFVVDKYVEIDGKKATVYGSTSSSGKEVKNKYNAIMAYIFNENKVMVLLIIILMDKKLCGIMKMIGQRYYLVVKMIIVGVEMIAFLFLVIVLQQELENMQIQ